MSHTISALFSINYSHAHYSALCSGIPAYHKRRFPSTATEMANRHEMGRNILKLVSLQAVYWEMKYPHNCSNIPQYQIS